MYKYKHSISVYVKKIHPENLSSCSLGPFTHHYSSGAHTRSICVLIMIDMCLGRARTANNNPEMCDFFQYVTGRAGLLPSTL